MGLVADYRVSASWLETTVVQALSPRQALKKVLSNAGYSSTYSDVKEIYASEAVYNKGYVTVIKQESYDLNRHEDYVYYVVSPVKKGEMLKYL